MFFIIRLLLAFLGMLFKLFRYFWQFQYGASVFPLKSIWALNRNSCKVPSHGIAWTSVLVGLPSPVWNFIDGPNLVLLVWAAVAIAFFSKKQRQMEEPCPMAVGVVSRSMACTCTKCVSIALLLLHFVCISMPEKNKTIQLFLRYLIEIWAFPHPFLEKQLDFAHF